MDDKNHHFDDFIGYVAMINDDKASSRGFGFSIPTLIAMMLILCLLSTCLEGK